MSLGHNKDSASSVLRRVILAVKAPRFLITLCALLRVLNASTFHENLLVVADWFKASKDFHGFLGYSAYGIMQVSHSIALGIAFQSAGGVP